MTMRWYCIPEMTLTDYGNIDRGYHQIETGKKRVS